MATTGRPASRTRAGGHGRVALERALSKLGLASRAQARELIAGGRVTVDSKRITNPLTPVVPEQAAIAIDGRRSHRSGPITIALHKPRGYVTTRSDPDGRKTVYDLIADVGERVVPVGRLDLATSGLLLFTNDTQLANWLTDPRSAIPRVYLVTVKGRVSDEAAQRLTTGVIDKGDRLSASAAVVRKASNRESHLTITLTEGKNREVRRLLDLIGHQVTRLRRVQFGAIELGTLAPAKWRRVSAKEMREAFPAYRRVEQPAR